MEMVSQPIVNGETKIPGKHCNYIQYSLHSSSLKDRQKQPVLEGPKISSFLSPLVFGLRTLPPSSFASPAAFNRFAAAQPPLTPPRFSLVFLSRVLSPASPSCFRTETGGQRTPLSFCRRVALPALLPSLPEAASSELLFHPRCTFVAAQS
ncbi:hypothetical protein BVRB_7g176980 [Beta vulgaris subsp. vulgaris]|nr:hypothetical protein BVRB_7g176980 [Beta vulgaris subsp. vulgaris]